MTRKDRLLERCCLILLAAALTEGSVRAQGPAPATAVAAPPIVFVPGTSGSFLMFSNGSVYWLDSDALLQQTVSQGMLSPSGDDTGVQVLQPGEVLDSVRVVLPAFVKSELERIGLMPTDKPLHHLPVYAPFLDWARNTFGPSAVYLAPYDWRKGAGHASSQRIDTVVDEALAKTGAKKVILLAHSLGGLVCRDYIAGAGKGKVDALISVGTPWLGAPKSARGLEWGYNFGVGFTTKPTPFLPKLYWYVIDPANPGKPIREEPPFRLTFLPNEATAGLARNFPCVYQQLPTADLQRLYGKPFLFGLSPEASLSHLRDKNPALYDESQTWRKDHLKDDNFGVAHYAIAGLCDSKGDPGDFQDMQMALPGDDHLTTVDGGGLHDVVNRRIIKERRRVFTEIQSRRIPVFLDEFIAMDTDVDWGDGTSPLLSATASAQRRANEPLDPSAAEKYLGSGVKVAVLALEPPYSHGTLLNDPAIRQEVLRTYSERREASGLGVDPRAEDVAVMTLELTTKAGDVTNGTVESVSLQIAGADFETNNHFFQNGEFWSDPLSSGATAKYFYHGPMRRDPATGAMRTLRRSDLPGTVLRLTKAGFSKWTGAGVRLLIDGRPVVERKEEFVLSAFNRSLDIPIP
ncbi:MAG: alpha/beta hydrolase [Paludisphaera borealis]|nr:alpha/beta hydrolase [Paludisphaera borealis]